MTSASELFYSRRSRVGRNSADLGLDSLPPDRNFLHSPTSHGRRNHRHDSDGCDPLRRYSHSRNHFNNNRVSHQERGSFRVEESPSQFGWSNRFDGEDLIGSSGGLRPPLSPSERLPGAVLLARARLSERLRGLPLAGISRRGRVSPNVNDDEIVLVDGSNRPFDASGWEIDNVTGWWSTNGSPYTTDSTRLQLLRERNKKPIGLTQEALDCLGSEVFSGIKEIGAEEAEGVSKDCSICLESFTSGDELIHLPCDHRFHAGCLHPWVRIRGDCPNCRKIIVVKKRTTMATL